MTLHPNPIVASIVGAVAVLVWRLRETTTPVTTRKLLIPPLGMSTGFSMFLFPPTRIPLAWGLLAFLVGVVAFSGPLIATSKLIRQGDVIMMKRSRAFLGILLVLLAVRFALRSYLEKVIDPIQTGSLVFVLAFGMLLPWRIAMYSRYRQMVAAAT